MKRITIMLLCSLTLAVAFTYAQDEGFQPARVIAFEKIAADVQHPEKADTYKMSMRIGDVIYQCKANEPTAVFNDWTINKEFPARVNEKAKIMQVKNFDGNIIDLRITGTKKPK